MYTLAPTWLTQLLRQRWVWAMLALGTALHLALALAVHLSVDEAHYALYASHLDWSYFDHPPLVGWLQWPAWLLGGSDMAMRVVPALCWALTALGIVSLSDTVFAGTSLPFWAGMRLDAWLLLISPLPHLLGLALVPDSLLMPLTCAVMAVCWRLCHAPHRSSTPLWVAMGLCLGLAGLAKYTAVLLALGAAVVLLHAHGWRLLTQRGPWLAVSVAALCVVPVFAWNVQHDWISLAYQLGHAQGSGEWKLRKVLVFVLVVLLAHGLLLPLAWRARFVAQSAQQAPPSAGFFCGSFALPTLLLLAYLSGRGSALPHWATPACLALIPPAAVALSALWQKRKRWFLSLAAAQASGFAAVLLCMVAGGIGSETGAQAVSLPGADASQRPANPFADVHGWPEAALQAQALAQHYQISSLAVMNWTLASRLAWYARPVPVKVIDQRRDQFDLWFGAVQPQESVLLVDWSQMSFTPPVGLKQFERCDYLGQMPVLRSGRQIAHFNFLHCQRWRMDSLP